MSRHFSAHGKCSVGTLSCLLLLFLLCPQSTSAQFSSQVKQDFQNIYDLVFAESRCDDRERCTMLEWDYVKELTNDLDETYIGPKVTEQPRNFYFNKENTDALHFASFVCKASEDMDSISFYKWYRDNVEIQVANPENSHISMAGGRLDINNPTEKDEGGYHCSASNLAGTSISRTRNLYAAYVGDFDPTEREETVSANRVAIIACKAPDFFKRLDYFWKRQILLENGTLLDEEEFIEQSNRFIIDENNGNLYMIKPNREDLNRVYRCVVRNEKEYEQETGSYDFIEGPRIHVRMSQDLPNLNDLSIKYPTVSNMEYQTRSTRNITMYCIADGGYDLLTYSWTVPNPEVGNYFFRYQGAKLEIIGAQLDNNGNYQCSVRNQDREVTISMELFVFERPRITKHVEDHQARISQEFTLSCEASGEPAPAYRWYYQGKPIQAGLGRSPNGNALAFINVQEAAAGMYQCEAYNEHGNAVSTAQLMVEEVEPIFVNQFGSRVDEKQVFEVGYPGKLHCNPFAIPIPIFSWSFQGRSISNSSKYQMWLDGTLYLTKVDKDDNGDYKCIAQGGSNSDTMKFTVIVIPQVDLQVTQEKQTTLVNRTLDLECNLGLENPDEGHFVWLLDGKELAPSPKEKMREIESFYRRLDSKFGSDDPAFILRTTVDKQQALKFQFPFFAYSSSPDQNPFYPSAGPGKFSRSNAGVRRGVTSEEQLREVNLWDPYDPYKSKEQYKQELEAEEAVVLKYYGTDISWYVEPLFTRREDLHYVMVGDGRQKGTLRIYRAQKWQQGTYTCCYMTLYGDTCKDAQVSVIGYPPRPANVHFNSNTKRLSWGNPGTGNAEDSLPIDKFVVQMETTALYPVPEFMQPYPLDATYSTPDPFFTIEAALLPSKGFQNITETDGDKSSIDLTSFVKKYCMLRFRVVALNALGASAPSLPTRGDLIPQGAPTQLVNNIHAGFAERARKKRLLAIAFDQVNVADFAADNCYFNVLYRKTGSGSLFTNQRVRSPFQNQLTLELPADAARNPATLDDYDVQIQIVNELGEGPLSPVVVIKEVPLAPQVTVTNVKSTPTSSTSVLITFTGIDLYKEPTFFGYQVEFFKYSEDDFDLTNNNYEVTSGNATLYTEVHVFDLEPAMNYKFHVKVINQGGLGPPSEQVFGETFMAEPSEQPQNVNVYTYKDQTVRVTWDAVQVTDGEAQLDGYRIFYWEYGIPDNESAYYEWRRNAERDEEVFLRDIKEGQRYNVIVQPVSQGGFGIRSEPFPFLMRTTHYNWLFQSNSPKFQPMTVFIILSYVVAWTVNSVLFV